MTQFNTISVIGLGYIGLPTAAVFAQHHVKVIGIDINEHTVNTINQGKIHIVEPDLEQVVQQCVNKGDLKASLIPEPADAFLIAVPTPFKGNNYEPDLSYIKSACKMISPVLKKGDLIVLESTSPVGATEKMAIWLSELRPDLTFPQQLGELSDIRIAHCPERVLPGHVMRELIENDRIIGGMTPKCSQMAVDLYKIFVKGDCIVTDSRTAEMCKLTENAFRDVNIAFANELSIICDKLGINVWELINLANRHPRVNILQPGCGVGGHCIAVDPWFIVNKTPELAKLIHTARLVNDSKPEWVINQVNNAVIGALQKNPNKPLQDIKIACLGLAFKPDIDDLRESPALKITEKLAEKYPNQILTVEPNIEVLPNKLNGKNINLIDLNQSLKIADILVILVDHKEFKTIKIENKNIRVIDTKGIFKR
ncbi:UDP-N-acetyl-D-mannosamine dehydrogenase [Pasteurella multocida]|uniref:UDP-N-acetyl-D-mannosamine dehydrogenase n=1 Tax=Pasteurella multocida TaxID=747 RepID=UPI002020B4D8|nr:UDP-N-acetyl-D-mannosamine dehydrogenase [Pasteurella multocida]MCL7798873.1 UDP-N-acetyl-D-mannosamine dehydrogenase [Pasteurella multocida]MCL7805070.1 UDP-N-acetyl-D-mannosamine dehydrogenase [Pasteurella multocida]MCL7808328.1 UDP-N-acetyl-D-mannosamine dehydrogenase [Pasteurella multocida]MCL7809795.1 UDP-N-acetyl-D-mannosamine dehydrogenase [Pasteurella multocida]MCL7813256.1 UDP-N-acetyl-D-mannosamine dehydrogenase [Pasteurella multocida]